MSVERNAARRSFYSLFAIGGVLFAITALASCGKDDADDTDFVPTTDTTEPVTDPCELESITVELGAGEEEYVPLADGDEMVMVRGPQLGWHLIIAFQAYQSEEIMWYEIAGYDAETGEQICQHGEAPVNQRLQTIDECRGTFPNVYCYMLTPMADALTDGECDTPPETLVGREIRLELQYRDESDRTATDELLVVAAPDPDDRTDCHEETDADTGDIGDTGGD